MKNLMRANRDPLLARAAEALRSGHAVRTQTRKIIDTARLVRLQRALDEKMVQIERAVSRHAR